VKALEGHYRAHQLATAHCSQPKARTQLISVPWQEFAATTKQLAHCAFVGLPPYYICRKGVFIFIEQQLLVGGNRTLSKVLIRPYSWKQPKQQLECPLGSNKWRPGWGGDTPPQLNTVGPPPLFWQSGGTSHFLKNCHESDDEDVWGPENEWEPVEVGTTSIAARTTLLHIQYVSQEEWQQS
jgi:hypothetical protein